MRLMVAMALLGGCVDTRFVIGDARYTPAPRAVAPALFVAAAPTAAWRAVGTIVVEADPAISERRMLAAAVEAGRKAGCELLVDRRLGAPLFSNLRRALPGGVLVAHEGEEPRAAPGSAPDSRAAATTNAGWQRRELVCGLWRRP